jgi:hypothetical protein
MRHKTRRRGGHDPFTTLSVQSWLTVRDRARQPLECQEVAAGADLRAVLDAARASRLAVGWRCGERVQVAIERFHPDDPGPMHCDPKPP